MLTFALALSCALRDRVRVRAGADDASRVELSHADERHVAADGGARPAALDAGGVAGRGRRWCCSIGAGLVLRSYSAARHADGGFDRATASRRWRSICRPAATTSARGLVAINRFLDAHRHPIRRSRARAWRSNVPLSLVDNGVASDHHRRLRAAIRRRPAVPLQRRRSRATSRRCASRSLAGRDFTRTRRRRRGAGGDRQRDAGAAHVADAGERHRQTPASRHR